MRESLLAKIITYLIYAVAFVPLIIFSDFVSPFHFGKVIVFRSLVYILTASYLLLILKDRSYLPKMTKVSWAFFFFAAAFSITTFASVLPYASFWGTLERMGGLFTFWHYFIYFIILTAVFKTEKKWMSLFNLVIFIGVLSAIYGFGQRTNIEFFVGSGGRSRIFGTIGNPALFAGYQILVSFLSMMLVFRSGIGRNLRLFYAGSGLITMIAALITAVRGSILGIGIGLLAFVLLYSAAYRSKKAKKAFLFMIAFLFLFVASALIFKDSSFVKRSGYLSRITDFSLTSFTVQTRFWAWEAGFKGWKETSKTVLLGWGPENFNIPFSRHFNPKFYAGPGAETLFDRAHNMFVEITVTMGLLGLLAYLWVFGASLKVLWRKIHNKDTMLYGIGLIPLLIAYAIHNSFIFDTSANFLTFFTILGFISFLALPRQAEEKRVVRRPEVNDLAVALSVVVLFIAVLAAIYFINVKPSQANYATTRAIVAGWGGDFDGAVAKYKEAISYDVPGKYEYRHRFGQYILEKTSSGKLTDKQKEIILFTIGEIQKNVDENKVDYLPYLYIARLYIILGKNDPDSEYNNRSLDYSLKALEIAPTFVRSYFEVAQAYLNKNDLDKGAEYFRKAAELNPDARISRWYWGIIEVERGNVNLGLEVIEGVLKTGYILSEGDLNRVLNVYVARGDLAKVTWISELLVEVNPTKAQYRASLAFAYARIGKIDEAVKQAHEAVKIDPAFESEARSFVESLGREW